MVTVARRARRLGWPIAALLVVLSVAVAGTARAAEPQDALPTLTEPVNDFGRVIDPASAASMDRVIRSLQAATGDAVVVVTIPTFAPYADIREYAVKLFENHGRGIGVKGKDNGLLILLAVQERRVWIEVGYGLEEFVTDGFAGETSREFMVPAFRQGQYGQGLAAGVTRIVGRIAEARHVTLENVPTPAPAPRRSEGFPWWLIVVMIAIVLLRVIGAAGRGGPRTPMGGYGRGWGGGGWSGWTSGIGSFGGGGGGGFGGGFGGFGGGGSGGGGGGASW